MDIEYSKTHAGYQYLDEFEAVDIIVREISYYKGNPLLISTDGKKIKIMDPYELVHAIQINDRLIKKNQSDTLFIVREGDTLLFFDN